MVVLKQGRIPGRHSPFVWHLTLADIQTQDYYETYIDPSYDNYVRWAPVIDSPNQGILLEKCLISKRGLNLVNADSPIQVTYSTPNQLAESLEQLWQLK